MKKYIKNNKYLRYGLVLLIGLILGWIFFHSPDKTTEKHSEVKQADQSTIWTCAMHPQIKMHDPGKCPICGMDLIPLNQNMDGSDSAAVRLTKEAAQLANVQTTIVEKQKPVKEVRLYGKIQADERLLQSQVAHVGGRIEKLLVNFTGETVEKGQTLALIYSPELVTAQQELLEAARIKQIQPEIYEASKERLLQWKLPESQIASIENSGKIQTNVEVVSNTSGIIMSRRVNSGDYISQGTVLFDVADLSRVWVLFDAYESDLPFLKKGEKIEFTVQAVPGKKFTGNISFIDPVIDPVTRVARVRMEIVNQSGQLKPEMFVTGIAKTGITGSKNEIIIPKSAVLWTGPRSVVYVKQQDTEEPVFKMREVELGPALGEAYVILGGLTEGEEIVSEGAFSVDAAAQLEGKPSMMNSSGGNGSTGHDHGSMTEEKDEVETETASQTNEPTKDFKKEINKDFVVQLDKVFDQYVVLKNNLVQSDALQAKQSASKVQKALTDINMNLLKGNSHNQWMDMSGKLNNSVKSIASTDDIEPQRKAFSTLSNTLYSAIKVFGLTDKTVYYQFCPMANDGKGAFWLSEISDIRNPYYGDEMLTCGETKETLK